MGAKEKVKMVNQSRTAVRLGQETRKNFIGNFFGQKNSAEFFLDQRIAKQFLDSKTRCVSGNCRAIFSGFRKIRKSTLEKDIEQIGLLLRGGAKKR